VWPGLGKKASEGMVLNMDASINSPMIQVESLDVESSDVQVNFHLHVNCFTRTPPRCLVALHEQRLLSLSEYGSRDAGGAKPLWIATTKTLSGDVADVWLEDIGDRLAEDHQMLGYIETEEVRSNNVVRYPNRPYAAGTALPLPRWKQHLIGRAADIHVFRFENLERDQLDVALEDAGFYEVSDRKQRIWTLLVGSRIDADYAFNELRKHFSVCGGVFKVEVEYTRLIRPIPCDFLMRPVSVRF